MMSGANAVRMPSAQQSPYDIAANAAAARRHLLDRVAHWVVRVGGGGAILCILAMLAFIVAEVVPLFRSASVVEVQEISNSGLRVARVSDDRGFVSGLRSDGHLVIRALDSGEVTTDVASADVPNDVVRPTLDSMFWVTPTGELAGIRLNAEALGGKGVAAAFAPLGPWKLGVEGRVARLAVAPDKATGHPIAVVAPVAGGLRLFAITETSSLFGDAETQEVRTSFPASDGAVAALAISPDGGTAYVGTTDGRLQRWNIRDKASPLLMETADATGDRNVGVTAMAFLLGGRSVIVGDAKGEVGVWFPSRDANTPTGFHLEPAHRFEALPGPITSLFPSPRDRRFVAADARGTVRVYHATTASTVMTLTTDGSPIDAVQFTGKANAVLSQSGTEVRVWSIDNPHPEVSFAALFGKIHYEGYDEPAYVWQSTGGSDEFEPKLSLIPLILGTMKGTLYALLFAMPLAILGALYTSQFCHPTVRGIIKPTVEIMAALPSVVLGFLAGLWLAPNLETLVPGLLAILVMSPAVVLLVGSSWHRAPVALRRWLSKPGAELVVLVPLVLIAFEVCLSLSHPIERLVFGGDFRHWLGELGWRIDQRNCIVVGFAMGFAVIPIIFTISEDALSNVPQRLISASLGLGATRWQTATRVVLPTASPGIFSAVMVGFGRAVGETMIVLMATGNTPVLDWSIFTGMRTLAANIAVEVPEAPYGGTLYRVLFLAALLLFLTTFLVNTVAELVRQRLRQRYQAL